ncbi:MAG TPA: hypothetical protein VL854_05950, partial [Nitrososphaeraceae archaeon]|nr:hypothetical protein [Nitrososphaeraceae archaeon]
VSRDWNYSCIPWYCPCILENSSWIGKDTPRLNFFNPYISLLTNTNTAPKQGFTASPFRLLNIVIS